MGGLTEQQEAEELIDEEKGEALPEAPTPSDLITEWPQP